MLGLDAHELRGDLAVGDVLGELLDDDGLGGDGVRGAHVGVDLLPGECAGGVSVDCDVARHRLSSFMVIAPLGQTFAQMPHPLQCDILTPDILSSLKTMLLSGQ